MFTHFPPVDTYNARLTSAELAHAASNYAEIGFGDPFDGALSATVTAEGAD